MQSMIKKCKVCETITNLSMIKCKACDNDRFWVIKNE